MPAGIHVADLVRAQRFEVRNSEQRVSVDRKRQSLFVPTRGEFRVRFRNDRVYLLLGTKQLEMTTPIASKLGFALAQNGGACFYQGDFVCLQVDHDEYHLLGEAAIQLGGIMLKKTDRSDDWQRETRRRVR